MKKLTLLASLFVTIAMMAQNRTMFVHHNGDIDLFFFAEIDSIRYSSIDVDSSQWSDMPIVQEIWTADSVYRYRMEEIDSVTVAEKHSARKLHRPCRRDSSLCTWSRI